MRKELKNIGLTDEEVNIYLFLLKQGASKVIMISKKLSMARTTVYRFLESLHNKGIVTESYQNNVRIFSAISPKRITEILQERMSEIENIVPELEKLRNKEQKGARVELYRGKEGIKAVLNDILKTKKDYVIIGESQKFFEELEFFCVQWLKKIERIPVKGKLLVPKGQKLEIAKNEKLKYVDKDLISEITTWVYGNKTAQFIWDEPCYVVLIESESVADSNRNLFNYLWNKN